MKKVLIAAALVATGASAQAADLPAKAKPYYKAPVARVYDWTGFYIGVNGGTGFGRSYTQLGDFNGGNASSRLGGWGALGGGQIGYNWQYGNLFGLGNVVLGVETDIQGAGFKDDRTCEYFCSPGISGFSVNQKLDWFGTVRGRVGVATGPVLSYFTGGFAYGGVDTTITSQFTGAAGTSSFSNTRTGWTLGSGVEAALGGNWTGKIEYLYVSLGTQTGSNPTAAAPFLFRSEVYEHVFRAGLNYRIGEHAMYVAEPVARWAGFYGGFDVGSAASINRSSLSFPFMGVTFTDKFNLSSTNGFTGGGQVGYNLQSANWVVGVEADFQGSSQRDDKACEFSCAPPAFTATLDQKLEWLGTARGRVGYSVGSTLFYFTGGAAYGDVKTNVAGAVFSVPFSQSITHTKVGYTVGGGIESPFNLFGWFGPHWTVKTEYLYVDLGHTSDVIPVAPGFGTTFTTHVREDLFRTGLNYHFNEPVVAKY